MVSYMIPPHPASKGGTTRGTLILLKTSTPNLRKSMVIPNLFTGNTEKEFHWWFDPADAPTALSLYMTGEILSLPGQIDAPDGNLLFIPNPRYTNSLVTPYHNNVTRKIGIEYNFEIFRPEIYPSRTQALFLCNSIEDAQQYEKFHKKHVEGRILINGFSRGTHYYSIHDSRWFDFLNLNATISLEDREFAAKSYWKGLNLNEAPPLKIYGHMYDPESTPEVLFYGKFKISDDSKLKLFDAMKEVYVRNPMRFPAGIQMFN